MKKKTKIFIGILVIIVAVLVLVKVFPSKKSVSEPLVPFSILTPTPDPKENFDVLEEQKRIETNYYPLVSKTPYRTTLFKVTYTGPLKLTVTMFDKDQNKIKNEVYKWIAENGVDPNTHQIEFVKPVAPTLAP